jgi:hypothetical protein
MSRLIVSNIETQNIKFDSDTTAFSINSSGALGNTTVSGTLAVTGVHTIGNNAVVTSEGGAATYSLPQSTVKAWNRTRHGNAMEYDGFGFSTVTDSGVGYYTPAFTNNMNNTNYGFLSSADDKSDGASIFVYNLSSSYTISTSGFRMSFKKYSYALTDPNENATVAVVGDLA